MAATNSADGREAITDGILQSDSQRERARNLLESIVIILAELVTPEPRCFPAGMFHDHDRRNKIVAVLKIAQRIQRSKMPATRAPRRTPRFH